MIQTLEASVDMPVAAEAVVVDLETIYLLLVRKLVLITLDLVGEWEMVETAPCRACDVCFERKPPWMSTVRCVRDGARGYLSRPMHLVEVRVARASRASSSLGIARGCYARVVRRPTYV